MLAPSVQRGTMQCATMLLCSAVRAPSDMMRPATNGERDCMPARPMVDVWTRVLLSSCVCTGLGTEWKLGAAPHRARGPRGCVALLHSAHQHPELQRCCELCDGCPAVRRQGQLVLTALQRGGHLQPVVALDGLLDLCA